MRLVAIMLLVLVLGVLPVTAQDQPEETETPEPPVTITIWWPDVFARVGDAEINPLLIEQADAFTEQFPNVIFEHRMKAVGQSGGIMSTLRSASNAARNALPTLTLVRRQDLLLSESNNYIYSMEGFPSSILGDLNNALMLGQIERELYGIPYLLDMPHVVYRPQDEVDYSDWTYDAIIEREQSIIFPAGRVSGLNDVLALQYIESGGLPLFSNELVVTNVGLNTVFNYYQASVDAELLTAEVLNYTAPGNYEPAFTSGDFDSAVFSSTQYLRLRGEDNSLAIAPIPTELGSETSILNGWIWVLVSQDQMEQEMAIEYLDWIFDTGRQSAVASDVGMLPSREQAIGASLENESDADFYLDMIENSVLPLSDGQIGAVGREIQTQFATILTLEQSAEDAVQDVISTVGQ